MLSPFLVPREPLTTNPHRAGRHDDPEEQRADMVRAEIMSGHRFHSFANQRGRNFVKWCVAPSSPYAARGALERVGFRCRHIDGHDYMWAVSELLDRAQEAIFILVRPPPL